MKFAYILVICYVTIASIVCNSMPKGSTPNMKDLDENMMDVRVYHENLGGSIKAKDADNAEWLLGGMDSLLQVVAGKFITHRKLDKPFEYFYKKDLQPGINQIREALDRKDFAAATSAYTLLTKKCNGCHEDHNVDKEILNWATGH